MKFPEINKATTQSDLFSMVESAISRVGIYDVEHLSWGELADDLRNHEPSKVGREDLIDFLDNAEKLWFQLTI